MGVAGSGKTTLARNILQQLWAVYLDNNHIVDPFFPTTRSSLEYLKLRPAFYRALYAIVEANLELGNSVLLDTPHIKESQTVGWRDFIQELARRSGTKLAVIRCVCTDHVLRSRLQSRGEMRDRDKLDGWEAFQREQPIAAPLAFPHLDIDTEQELTSNTALALNYICFTSAS